MGEELQVARPEEEGQPVLLAITGAGEAIYSDYNGNQRKEKSSPTKKGKGRKTKNPKAKSQSSSKAEGADASPSKQARRRRDNKDRESDRGDEREHKPSRRSAQELGIKYPGHYCSGNEETPHYWSDVDKVGSGTLLQCKRCREYLWLPLSFVDAMKLSNLMRKFGEDEGYCRFLNKRRPAKLIVAKMQDLRKLIETSTLSRRQLAKMVDKIMSDKGYDREMNR